MDTPRFRKLLLPDERIGTNSALISARQDGNRQWHVQNLAIESPSIHPGPGQAGLRERPEFRMTDSDCSRSRLAKTSRHFFTKLTSTTTAMIPNTTSPTNRAIFHLLHGR